MEALTAAAIGLLTIYDVQGVDRGMRIEDVRCSKGGGKSGHFRAKEYRGSGFPAGKT